ncbi:toll/interleukin-1 receptor domain-containing protein [Zooshikella sp. RANM57]|uniref:toll/interleukin-1 receptor domain-containing protein n=1 Tax=Zooshikella sp. RANM57 TaxID=3425863 RepID=UPI003D6F8DA3
MKMQPLKMFISYCHKDEEFLNELREHLHPLTKKELIEIWHDKDLVAGDHLDSKILTQLESADLVVCLISAQYISSYSCFEKELVESFSRMSETNARIIPVIIKPCSWKETFIVNYLCLPKDGKAIASWGDKDEGYVNVVEEIKKVAEDVKKNLV